MIKERKAPTGCAPILVRAACSGGPVSRTERREAVSPFWLVATSQEKLNEVVTALDSKKIERVSVSRLYPERIGSEAELDAFLGALREKLKKIIAGGQHGGVGGSEIQFPIDFLKDLSNHMEKHKMYEIYVQTHISAAHYLRGYEGDCRKVHGHNWIIKTFVQCSELNELDMGLDFKDLKRAVKEVCEQLDHADLNHIPYFKEHNPTSESMVSYLFVELGKRLNDDRVRVSRIEVQETPGHGAIYWE